MPEHGGIAWNVDPNDSESEDGESVSEPEQQFASEQDGTEADNDDQDLTLATMEFLADYSSARVLRMNPGSEQLDLEAYIEYLGLDMAFEPELVWVCREMLCAPMPPNAEMLVARSNYVYFHDLENDYYTFEHPLTQRYLKILEKERLDVFTMRTKPSVHNLLFQQPTALFFKKFQNMQIACELCNVNVATRRCNQCMEFCCASCFDAKHIHADGPKKNHTWSPTPAGAVCSVQPTKKPQVYDASEGEYYTFKNYEKLHNKGNRRTHTAMMLPMTDSELVSPQICEECEDAPAAFRCDQCMDFFCVKCFWKCHLNGERRKHTVTKVMVQPMCNQCGKVRATIYDEQAHELNCTDCFTMLHYKGNRQFHMFTDANNLLLLLERLDPSFEEHMERARPRVLWAITQLQGWTRGIEARKHFRQERDLVTKIQRRWRGAMTRKKLLNMLDQYKWRRRQVNDFFLCKTRAQRKHLKQQFLSTYATLDTTAQAVSTGLKELKQQILETAASFPLEDMPRTTQQMTAERARASLQPLKVNNSRLGQTGPVSMVNDPFATNRVQGMKDTAAKFANEFSPDGQSGGGDQRATLPKGKFNQQSGSNLREVLQVTNKKVDSYGQEYGEST